MPYAWRSDRSHPGVLYVKLLAQVPASPTSNLEVSPESPECGHGLGFLGGS